MNSSAPCHRDPAAIRAFLTPRVCLAGLLAAAALVAIAATLAGFLGGAWWGFDLFAHFRVQYVAGLAPLAVLLWRLRQRRLAVVAAGAMLLNAAVVVPLYVPPAAPTGAGGEGVECKVMLVNVNTAHGDPVRVLAAVRAWAPDLLVVQEISACWCRELAALENEFPHTLLAPREDNFGIGLYSRLPLATARETSFGSADVPSLVAQLTKDGARATLIATHPLPPRGRDYVAWRDEQLRLIAAEVVRHAAAGEQVIVLGDLNVTPWSAQFRRFLRRSGLHDSERGFGVQPTWPVPLPPLLIPLDHCLHTSDIITLRRQTGPTVGSDHLPLRVALQVPRAGR